MSIDITGFKNIKEKPINVIKVKRPKKPVIKPENIEKLGDEKLAEVTGNFNVNIKHDDILLARDLFKNKLNGSLEENAKELENINWGGFDVEKLVDVLYALSISATDSNDYYYQRVVSKRIFRALLNNESMDITILFSRQSGKTELCARTGVTCCAVFPALAKLFPDKLDIYKKGFWLGIYAPSGEQALTMYYRMKEMAAKKSAESVFNDPDIQADLDKRSGAKWSNGSFFHAQSASPRSNSIESKTYHMIFLDECQDMDSSVIEKSLLPMLAWNNGLAVLSGTVNDKVSYFYTQILKNKELSILLPEEKKLHFEFNYKEVIKHNPRYKKHIDTVILKHGEDSPFFKMSYALEWSQLKQSTFTPEDLKKYMMHPNRGLKKFGARGRFVAGIDLASKMNSSVVTVLEVENTELVFEDGYKDIVYTVAICDWLELKDMPYQQQRYAIYDFLNNYNVLEAVVIDATGAGDPVFEQITQEWDTTAILQPFIFTASTKDRLAKIFDEFFYSNRIILPANDEARKTFRWQSFYLQFLNLTRVIYNTYSYYEKGGSYKKARDDYFDSLCLALYGVKNILEKNAEIEVLDSNFKDFNYIKRSTYNNMEELRALARKGLYVPYSVRKLNRRRRGPEFFEED